MAHHLDLGPHDSAVALDAVAHRARLAERRRRRMARVEPRGARQYTARERIDILVDAGSFVEITPSRTADGQGTGVVTGWARVDGRGVVVIAHDAAVASGAIGAVFADAVQKAQRFGIDRGFPIVYLNDSGGARVPDGVFALHGCGGIFALNVAARRRVPQISVVLGPCAGAAAYSPALTDWTVMVEGHGHMFLTGPDIVRAATGEDASADDIGGSALHTRTSGVAHLETPDEASALAATRHLLSFLPSHAGGKAPLGSPVEPDPVAATDLPYVVPDKASVVFDMNRVLDGVLDAGDRLELMAGHARSVLTVLGRLDGRPVGVVANQPAGRGGILDSQASVKAARFVEFCGRFGLPVLTFVDVPGFLPGTVEESRGVITHGAKLLTVYIECPTPRLTVVVRKAYGGAYIAMGAKSLGADFQWAWSNAEIAVMGPGGAVTLLNRRELAAADDPVALRDELAARYREEVARPWIAAEGGIVDDVIVPEETRGRLVEALQVLEGHA